MQDIIPSVQAKLTVCVTVPQYTWMTMTCSALSGSVQTAKNRVRFSRCSVGLVHEYMNKSMYASRKQAKFMMHGESLKEMFILCRKDGPTVNGSLSVIPLFTT